MIYSEDNKVSWRHSKSIVRVPTVTADELLTNDSCRFPPIKKLLNEATQHKKATKSTTNESDLLKTKLKIEDNVKKRLMKTYENYMQNRSGNSLLYSLSHDKNCFDNSSMTYGLYGDDLRAKDLRVRLYDLSEKSRTYKQFNPFSLKTLSYEFDNFPKYVFPNYNKKKNMKKDYIQLNEKILLIDKELPFCSFKHDPYHWRLSERLKSKLEKQLEPKLKRKIKIPKISGIPKIKKKAATIPKNPFKSSLERNIEKNWLKKYKPPNRIPDTIEKNRDTKKVVIETIENVEEIIQEKQHQNDVKSIEKLFKIDSISMTCQSFLVNQSENNSKNTNSNQAIDSSSSKTLSETFHEADVPQKDRTYLNQSSSTDFKDEESNEKNDFPKLLEAEVVKPENDDLVSENVIEIVSDQLKIVQEATSEVSNVSELKESEAVKSSREVLNSDKLAKQDGCTKVKNSKKTEIESSQNDLLSNSSDIETSKEELTTDNFSQKIEVESHDTTSLAAPKEVQKEPEKRIPSPKIIEKNTEKNIIKRKRKPRKSLVQVIKTEEVENTTENDSSSRWADNQAKLLALKRKRKAQERFDKMKERRKSTFNDLEFSDDHKHSQNFSSFLEPYCIVDPELVDYYERVFKQHDNNKDGYLEGFEALLAIDYVIPDIDDAHIEYIYRILELSNLPVYTGKMNQNLFNIVLSLTRKIESLEGFMKGMLNNMDFQSIDWKFYHGKKLFKRLVDNSNDETMSIDCLLFEIEAGLLSRFENKQIRKELSKFSHFNLLDFLTYLPLFTYIHDHIVHQPLKMFET